MSPTLQQRWPMCDRVELAGGREGGRERESEERWAIRRLTEKEEVRGSVVREAGDCQGWVRRERGTTAEEDSQR